MTNAAYCMDTAVSNSQYRAAAGIASQQEHGTLGQFMNLSLLGDSSADSASEQNKSGANGSRAHLQGAMQQVEQLQADIAGMEAVVTAVRGVHPDSMPYLLGHQLLAVYRCKRQEWSSGYYNKRTVTGRRLPKLVSQAAMRERAQEIIKLRHEQYINSSAAETKHKASETQLAPLKFDMFFQPGHQCATTPPALPRLQI